MPLWLIAAISKACLASPAKLRATKVALAINASMQMSNETIGWCLHTSETVPIGSCAELTFGKDIDAVVLHDVDHRRCGEPGV